VQALIDIKNLSELLFVKPDLVDEPNAKDHPYASTMLTAVSIGSPGPTAETLSSNGYMAVREGIIESDIEMAVAPQSTQSIGGEIRSKHHLKGLSVEFGNVSFHYSKQPANKGLKNISFFVAEGTTTAIVGDNTAIFILYSNCRIVKSCIFVHMNRTHWIGYTTFLLFLLYLIENDVNN
jgi:ABC-type multidrug transport system fused ATPase/permease subunit